MTILSTDLRFFAAQYPTDEAYGGGLMSSNLVQDGVASNVFPVASEIDMNLGAVQLRKVYAAVLSENTDMLVGASVNVYTPPSDPNYEFAIFKWGDKRTTRAEAAAALAAFPYVIGSGGGSVSGSSNPYTLTGGAALQVGDRILVGTSLGTGAGLVSAVAKIEAIAGSSFTLSLYYLSGSPSFDSWVPAIHNPAAAKLCAPAETTDAVVATDTVIPLSRLEAQVIPALPTYPLAPRGLSGSGLQFSEGLAPIFRAGDIVLVRNIAGTVSELVAVDRVDFQNGTIELLYPLENGYAAGSIVTPVVDLSDMQAQVGISFSQQTWTRTFSDALIGSPIGANFDIASNPIEVINEGTETERWAIVFSSATDFRLIGETFGQIASGTITTDFSPINPITNQPYFTIPAAGWGTGWQTGNVLRFNTIGARAPFWVMRTTTPTPAASTDSALIQLRGSF